MNCGCGCDMMDELESFYLPSGLKFAVNMTCEDFDMDTDDWTITVTRGRNSIVFDKDSAIKGTDEQWYICIDTEALGPGRMDIIFEALVPDDDFEGGVRKEVMKYPLINGKSV